MSKVKPREEEDGPQERPRLPRCLKALPHQIPCRAQILAGAQRLDACLARTVAELRADKDGSVFGPGWPRGNWPEPKAPPPPAGREDWLSREGADGVAAALCSASPGLRGACVPLQFLGAGSYGTVFGGAGGLVALKFTVPCPFTWFSPRHEFETQAHLAAAGAAFGVSELLNRSRGEGVAHQDSWKGRRGAEFLTTPTLERLAEAIRDCACVLVMERSDGTLTDYFARLGRTGETGETPEKHGAAVGAALGRLLATVRESGAVHNDAKVDNVGYLRRQGAGSLPIFRFMDCGLSFRRDTLASVPRGAERALAEGGRRDGCVLIASLVTLAQALQGDRQRRACAAAAWQLSQDPWFQCQPNAPNLTALGEAARERAREAARPVRTTLKRLRPA